MILLPVHPVSRMHVLAMDILFKNMCIRGTHRSNGPAIAFSFRYTHENYE